MKELSAILVLFVFWGCQPKPNEQAEKHPTYSIEQFNQNTRIAGGEFSADESKMLISTDESGIFNVYEVDLRSGDTKPLTQSAKESYIAAEYFPKGKRFVYGFDKGGNENFRLYMMAENGQTKALTEGDSVRNKFEGFSRDEKSMFYQSNKRDPRFMDLYELPIASIDEELGFGEMFYKNESGLDVMAISPNKNMLALVKSLTNANAAMYLYHRDTGEQEDISKHEGDVKYVPQFFSLDNKTLYFLTDEGAEFVYLAKRNLETGVVSKVFEDKWDVSYAYQSYHEKYLVVGVNDDALMRVEVIEQASGKSIELPTIEGGSIQGVKISKSEQLARLTVGTSTSPNDIYLYNFETGDLKKLTEALNKAIDQKSLVEGKVVRYKSFDGLDIPAIYYQPKVASATQKVPALVWVHGGPGGQSMLRYSALIQYLANHGYAVLAVNNRGSSGYGKSFYHMDDKNHGDKDLKDCIAAKDFLAQTGVVDMEKVGIIGGSYGGYMVMAAMTFEPEAFKVGVNIFGVTNWLRTLKSIPPYWESFRKALYDELGDPFSADSVRLYEISPLFHAQNVNKPLMVLQGANDVRVLQIESDEIVAKVKANGVPVEYIVFDDEGHGFKKKENQVKGYQQVKVFLDKHLSKVAL